jgi:DNA repair protein RecO (recombination protein O)
MPLCKTPAIILRSTPYGEADRIVTLYTLDFGKIKGIAKGAKRSQKRFANTLEIGSCVTATFFEKETAGLVRLSHCDLLQPFASVREDLQKLTVASYFIELISELTAERIRNQALFHLLTAFLGLVDQGNVKEEIQRVFEIRLLANLGYQPLLDRCLRCKTKIAAERVLFAPREGGIVCHSCSTDLRELVPVSLGTVKTLLLAQTIPLGKSGRILFSTQARRESQSMLGLFLSQYLGKELKTKNFLKQMGM